MVQVIKDYPLYTIDENGEIKKTTREKPLNQTNNNGYFMVCLTNEKGLKHKYVHRLVAEQFIPKPQSDQELWVNHKDGNKANNHVSNLEWSTISQNIQHSYDVLNRKIFKGKEHWNYGKKYSVEHRRKLSEAKIGEKHPKFKGYYITPKGKFSSSIAAGIAEGVDNKTIFRRIARQEPGYSFEPVSQNHPTSL